MGAAGRTSAWQSSKRAPLCDSHRAHTFAVRKDRRKAEPYLCVDRAVRADVEHSRLWYDCIQSLTELNSEEKEDVWRADSLEIDNKSTTLEVAAHSLATC